MMHRGFCRPCLLPPLPLPLPRLRPTRQPSRPLLRLRPRMPPLLRRPQLRPPPVTRPNRFLALQTRQRCSHRSELRAPDASCGASGVGYFAIYSIEFTSPISNSSLDWTCNSLYETTWRFFAFYPVCCRSNCCPCAIGSHGHCAAIFHYRRRYGFHLSA